MAGRCVTGTAVTRWMGARWPRTWCCGVCSQGTAALAGTGMEQVWGGGTTWAEYQGPVVPGETITLEFMIFDVEDHIYGSVALVDAFEWIPATE